MGPADQWTQKEHHLSLAAPIDIVKPDAIDCYGIGLKCLEHSTARSSVARTLAPPAVMSRLTACRKDHSQTFMFST